VVDEALCNLYNRAHLPALGSMMLLDRDYKYRTYATRRRIIERLTELSTNINIV